MNKDFECWGKAKANLHYGHESVFFHERQIWFAALGINIGFEEDGKGDKFLRPVLILKKFSNNVLWAVALTKTKKYGQYYFSFVFKNDESTVILSQLRLIDSKRLRFRMGTIQQSDFDQIKEKLRQLLA